MQDCRYASVLDKYNNWVIMGFDGKETDDADFTEIHKVIIDGRILNMVGAVKVDGFGAIDTDDRESSGYYIVQFISELYTLQKAVEVDGQHYPPGEIVCKGRYFSPSQQDSMWYHTPEEGDIETIVPLRTLVKTDIKPNIVSDRKDLPAHLRNLTEEDLPELLPFLLSDDDHKEICDKKRWGAELEYERQFDVVAPNDAESDVESEEELECIDDIMGFEEVSDSD